MKVKSGSGFKSPQGVGACGKPKGSTPKGSRKGMPSPESVGKKGKPTKAGFPGGSFYGGK